MAMTEKDQFLQTWDREFQTTKKVMNAFPEAKLELKPHGKCPSARELAWRIVSEEPVMVNGALTGQFDFASTTPAPKSLKEILTSYDNSHKALVEKIRKMSDADWQKTVKFMVAPKTVGDIRSGDILWMLVMDSIHHRGQFSIYLRMADGKVPSIYGPTADEPWM